ncbi:MAG: CBS domain-containing protein [Nitrospinae bacterium]|nr:CBS domain-containing protein [Nitrospinota bacterium]
MIVGEIMVKHLITIKKTDSLKDAQGLMVKHSIRHLPVIDGSELLGIITESDIRGAFIQQGNRNKGGEIQLMDPARMKVNDHMTRNALTVSPDTHIEDAALLIYQNKIGALPVVRDGKLAGIVSIMDILGLFVDMMGIIHSSSRIDVVMNKAPKNFEAVSSIINKNDVNIISVGMAPYAKDDKKQVYFFRLDLCKTKKLVKEIEAAGYTVLAALD